MQDGYKDEIFYIKISEPGLKNKKNKNWIGKFEDRWKR